MSWSWFSRPKTPTPPQTTSTQNAPAYTAFSLALTRHVAQAASGNVVLSPLGVLAAMALTMSGADGQTRAVLATTLFGNSQDADAAEESFASQLRQLLRVEPDKPDEADQTVLLLASSLWVDSRFALAPTFINHAHALYQAEAAMLDFTAPSAAPTINAWAKQHTNGRIAEIVSAKMLAGPPPAEIALVNAVYFQARWEHKFSPNRTRPGLFTRANGTTHEARFMHQTSEHIGYLAGDKWQAVALRYEGFSHSFSMLVFVPNEPTGLPDFLGKLDAANWASWHAVLTKPKEIVEVDLALPRFRIEWSDDLAPALQQLGLAAAFSPGADFTPMGFRSEAGGGRIGAVLHKTYLAVDEEGTEAAAVTAVLMVAGSAPPPAPPRRVTVKANSPFLYAIVDNDTGALIFTGTICDLA